MPRITKLLVLGIAVFLFVCWRSEPQDAVSSPIYDPQEDDESLYNGMGGGKPDRIDSNNRWFKGMKLPACEEYTSYASSRHPPFSKGPLQLPYMRPPPECRTFKSQAVEELIESFRARMKDADLFRIFENALPNTLDTTILWFDSDHETPNNPRTFISTGDIHAEWLRDSARQLSVYQKLIPKDDNLKQLIKGAILQQAEYIKLAPYCNAFQPPLHSKVTRKPSTIDNVTPVPPWKHVFECKWELDSLASFLTLSNEYLANSIDTSLLENELFVDALFQIARILSRESASTFSDEGTVLPFPYSFRRNTDIGSETLPLSGTGNPVNSYSGLVRSAFRPSDDACIYQFLIPSNIHLLVELQKLVPYLQRYNDPPVMSSTLSAVFEKFIQNIESGIQQHAIINHKKYGKVYAFEVDGYGGVNIMDDANLPSLLSLPDLGYGSVDDEIYQNTRKMILSVTGNPYFLKGKYLQGIGGPHVGLFHAWPMSLLVQIRTSNDDDEIMQLLEMVKSTTAGLGLMHEGVQVNSYNGKIFTRPWFSWCNSEFGKTILDLADRKPWLIFKDRQSGGNL